MKKKMVSLLLIAAMGVTMLAGCGNGAGTAGSSTADSSAAGTSAAADSSVSGSSTETAAADSSASVEEGKVVNIYCWNDEFKSRYEAYAKDLADKHGVKVNFVIVANDNNAYQNNLDAALQGQDAAATDRCIAELQQLAQQGLEQLRAYVQALENPAPNQDG